LGPRGVDQEVIGHVFALPFFAFLGRLDADEGLCAAFAAFGMDGDRLRLLECDVLALVDGREREDDFLGLQ
jgi:hypothetical protein